MSALTAVAGKAARRALSTYVCTPSAAGSAPAEMTAEEPTKDCPRCSGSGKYADRQRGPLVEITCARCEGSGEVAADAPDEPPAPEPPKIPFGTRPE